MAAIFREFLIFVLLLETGKAVGLNKSTVLEQHKK